MDYYLGDCVRAEPLQARSARRIQQNHGGGETDRGLHRRPSVPAQELLVRGYPKRIKERNPKAMFFYVVGCGLYLFSEHLCYGFSPPVMRIRIGLNADPDPAM